jgi:hypothetical protein
MRTRTAALALAAAFVAGTAAPSLADHHEKPAAGEMSVEVDLSSPKATVKSMSLAALAGDLEAMKATIDTRDDRIAKMIDVAGPMITATSKFGAAANEKFGDAAGNAGPVNMTTIKKKIDEAEVVEDGDTAKLTIPPMTTEDGEAEGQPTEMELVKVDGKWYIEPGSIDMDAEEFNEENMEQAKKIVPAMAKAVDEVTKRIKADEFETAEEAQQALQQSMMAAMVSAMQPPMAE